MTYRFEFNGRLRQGEDRDQVAQRIAKLFSIEPSEASPLLTEQQRFVREGLNEFTAKSYQKAFERCGAVGFVFDEKTYPQTQNEFTPPTGTGTGTETTTASIARVTESESTSAQAKAVQPTVCPKCGSSSHNDIECFDCGIFIEKWRERLEAERQEAESAQVLASEVDDETRYRTSFWLKLSAYSFIGLYVADGLLLKLNIDLGYTPYLIAHLVLLRACFLVVRNKGYSFVVGLLGLFSLAGLAIVILLPDKMSPENKASRQEKLLAGFCMAIFLYVGYGTVTGWLDYQNLKSIPMSLREGRHVYPSSQFDSDPTFYHQQQQAMAGFLEQKLQGLREASLRPNQVETVANRVFAELARYSTWRNYQTYLHAQQGQPIPVPLQEQQVDEDESIIGTVIKRYFDVRKPQPSRLHSIFNQWFFGPGQESISPFWPKLNQDLLRVIALVRHHKMDQESRNYYAISNDGASPERYQIDLTQLDFFKPRIVTMEVNRDVIVFHAPTGPMTDNPLVLGFYLRPYTPRRTFNDNDPKIAYQLEWKVLSAQLPNKYLFGMFNALSHYAQPDF